MPQGQDSCQVPALDPPPRAPRAWGLPFWALSPPPSTPGPLLSFLLEFNDSHSPYS